MLRNLPCAGLLAGLLLAAPVWSQSPMMYVYHGLSEYGGSMFGYGETGLWAPSEWCQAFAGFCWDQYVSYVQLDLRLDSSSVAGSWSEQYNAAASTSVWSTVEVGRWQMTAHHREDVWYREDYWEWPMYAVLSQEATLEHTVYPLISISGGQIVYDGDWSYFYVTVERGTPTSYAWSFDYPFGAGNDPSVTFSNPDDEMTETDGHWFAYPDGECSASGSALYDINATVGFQTGPLSETTMLDVVVPWYPAGIVLPPTLQLVAVYYQSGGLWRVHPSTYAVRGNPSVWVYVPSYSQFYGKANAHEQVHYDQYVPGGNFHLSEDLWNPADARNAIINLTHTTKSGLDALVQATLDAYDLGQLTIDDSRKTQAEAEAYGVSDNITPRYIYQGGCAQ